MATMQKPKQKKKKKIQVIQQETEDDEQYQNEYEILEDINECCNEATLLDFPIASTAPKCNEIYSHECFVSSEYNKSKNDDDSNTKIEKEQENNDKNDDSNTKIEKEQENNDKNDDDVKKNTTKDLSKLTEKLNINENLPKITENKVTKESCSSVINKKNLKSQLSDEKNDEKEQTPSIQNPTAPLLDIKNIQIQPKMIINYPDLKNITENEAKFNASSLAYHALIQPSILASSSSSSSASVIQQTLIDCHRQKPFTAQQLKELYNCLEIDVAEQFENEFLSNTLKDNYDNDPLYYLLQQYLNERYKLKTNSNELQQIQRKIEQLENDLWQFENRSVQYRGICGDSNAVRGSEEFRIAVLNENNLEKLHLHLNELRNLLCFSYTINVIQIEAIKLKIEQIIREILTYPAFENLYTIQDVGLYTKINPDMNNCVTHLRRSISILFTFIRRPSSDKEFTKDLKKWITKLLSLHLRIATREDHWFLLHHILRCPSGISQWATQFIQIPFSNYSENILNDRSFDVFINTEINHCISILKIILMPIKRRNEFLIAFSQSTTAGTSTTTKDEISDPVKEDLWILVDSDGEDSEGTSNNDCPSLRENDLISLLNQIPFETLFRFILKIIKKHDDYIISIDLINGNYLLKLIGFFSSIVEIFGEGLLTYNTEKYKQFAKRLGRLIRHTIQYLSDYHKLFISNKHSKDPYQCERIKIEFDAFVIKCCHYIYRTRNLGTWQYFSSLPFANLDLTTCWHLFYSLNFGFSLESDDIYKFTATEQNDDKFWERFNLATADLSHEDMYYLLQAFCSLAIERDRINDWNFIQQICSHILNIGFILTSTKDTCYKTSRDILVNICSKYPELITHILYSIKDRVNEIDSIIYLFKSLPINQWKPEIQAFEILSQWLLNYSYDKNENILARIIISHLNWEYNNNNTNNDHHDTTSTISNNDNNDNDKNSELFLSYEIHVRMACLICEASNKHTPECVGYSGVSESVRQVSSIIENQTIKEQFISWCWSIIATLHLHLMDQHRFKVKKFLSNPSNYIYRIPECEKFNIIFQGVTELRPLSIYASILISLWGHSIPLICQKGFSQLKLLLNDYRHAIVIRCLYMIMPLFLECPEALCKNDEFIDILKILLNADRTYIKMAKELITTNSPGPVLELLSNMMQSQIINYSFYCQLSPTMLIDLWLQALTNIPNWTSLNVIHLIDLILKIAYQFTESWHHCKEYFRKLFKCGDDPKTPKKIAISLFLGTTNTIKNIPTPTADYPWLAIMLLELEYEIYENQTKIWPEFLRNLCNGKDRKSNLDNALKKAITVVGCTNFNPQSLVLYKYANIISIMDVGHHLFPIMCQMFFNLYLMRIPFNNDEERFQHVYGVSDKFYEYNITLMKKLKAHLKLAEEYYTNQSKENAKIEDLFYFYSNCSKIMKSYLLWLEETSINHISKDQNIDLPPQFRSEKLKEIFDGNLDHWTEFIYLPAIRKEQKDASYRWLKSCFRYNNGNNNHTNNNNNNNNRSQDSIRNPIINDNTIKFKNNLIDDPINQIKNHLKSYDKPIDPPKLEKIKPIFDPIDKNQINSSILFELQINFKVLIKSAKQFTNTLNELSSLSGNYHDLIPLLYNNVPYKINKHLQCTSFLHHSCTRPAQIIVELQQPIKNDDIQRKMNCNRDRHSEVIKQLLSQNVKETVFSIRKIEHIIKYFILFQLKANDENQHYDGSNITDYAIQFFYDIIKTMNEDITTFPITNDLCLSILSDLGVFICNNQETQGIKILETILKRPELLKILSDLFIPSKTNPEYFISMYKFLIDSHMRRCDKKILFVLFSKFDLQNWLKDKHPKLSEINRLLQLIQIGLENWNQPETALLQDQFRRHLIQIFEYEFPEHYGEVLQLTLNCSSEQRIMPIVLLDLINSILIKCNCDALTLNSNTDAIVLESMKFATQQNLFNFKAITDTTVLLSKHFQNERLQHGLHGLYPKHKNYCVPLSIWFSCFGHACVASAIYSYPGILADQICDWIFAPIVDMYSPWLVTYTAQNMIQQTTANWIKQLLSNGKILYPWSELHVTTAQIMITSFINCLQYILEKLPVSNSILGHVFSWYDYHFAKTEVHSYIRLPIHSALTSLPWMRFQPQPGHIDIFHRILQEYLPECHSFLGFIFMWINWSNWIDKIFKSWNFTVQTHIITQLLQIFIQISFEPHLHDDVNMSKILEESLEYPWNLIDYQGIEKIFNWLVITVDPVIIIKLPSECNSVDLAVLELLKQSCGILLPSIESSSSSKSIATKVDFSILTQSKRLLYVRSVVRLLRACATKHQKLLATKEGLIAYQNAIIELIENIEQISNMIISLMKSSSESEILNSNIQRNHYPSEQDVLNMISEIICSLPTQSESTSKLFIDAIVVWQTKCNAGSYVVSATLTAIGLCKSFAFNMYLLLESTIHHYFRSSDDTKDSPLWSSIMQRLGHIWNNLDLMILLKGPYLLILHGYIINRIQNTEDIGEKITFLEDLSQLLEPIKISEVTESKISIIWGIIIVYGCKILQTELSAKKPLLMLARYLQIISTQSEGWSEGLLGVIGLKKDSVSNKRKILTRCLSCIIFSLFPDKSTNEIKQSQEFLLSLEDLKNVSASKKYNDVKLLSTKAIKIIEDNYFPNLQEIQIKVFNIISLLYDDNNYVLKAREIWKIDKCHP